MPPFIAGSTFEVRIVWTNNGEDFAVNVLHYLVPPAAVGDAAAATDYAADVQAAWTASGAAAYVDTNVGIDRVGVRDIRVANQAMQEAVVGAGGTSASDILPKGTALCVTTRTALAGRSFRGRIYQAGLAENANDANGNPVAACAAAVAAFWDDLRSVQVSGNTWTMGVTSRVQNGVTLNPAVTNAVTSLLVRDLQWDSQRRRNVPGI